MCIVIDVNTLPPVFSDECNQHKSFRHIKEWIDKGRGFLVFGGTRYKNELKKAYRYLRLIRQMKDAGKAVPIKDQTVDQEEIRITKLTAGTGCDDQHIIALLCVSRCPLFCSADRRSFKYITDKALYQKGMKKVKIYSSEKNRALLKPMDCRMLCNIG